MISRHIHAVRPRRPLDEIGDLPLILRNMVYLSHAVAELRSSGEWNSQR